MSWMSPLLGTHCSLWCWRRCCGPLCPHTSTGQYSHWQPSARTSRACLCWQHLLVTHTGYRTGLSSSPSCLERTASASSLKSYCGSWDIGWWSAPRWKAAGCWGWGWGLGEASLEERGSGIIDTVISLCMESSTILIVINGHMVLHVWLQCNGSPQSIWLHITLLLLLIMPHWILTYEEY